MKTVINLLPPIYRRQRLVRRRVVEWSLVLLAALSAISAARWYKVREYHVLSRQLAAISREGRPAQTMLRDIAAMREQIQRLQRHQGIAQELERQRPALALFAAISRAAQQTDGRLRVVDCRVVDLQATETRENPASAAAQPGTITLVGVALDSPTVAEFHDGLLQSGLFADVKLIKSNEREAIGAELFDYEVRCEL